MRAMTNQVSDQTGSKFEKAIDESEKGQAAAMYRLRLECLEKMSANSGATSAPGTARTSVTATAVL